MRNTWKKTAAFLLAFTLAAVPLSQTGAKDGLFGRSSIVAYAAEESETFNTDYYYEDDEDDSYGEPYTYTGTHFKIDVTYSGDEDGFFLYSNGQHRATITALNGENITKIEVVRGYYDGQPSVSSSAAVKYINGDTFTFTNINAASVTLDKCTGDDLCQIKKVKIYYGDPVYDISNATVNLGADNSVASITVGSNTITDLSGFDITYGTDDSHEATSVPTDAGTYYAYVTPKSGNETYIGTAKSASFEVAAAPTMTSASVTLNDGFGLNFYVDNITDATGYTVMFDGVCDENGTEAALTEKDGKFFATANVNAKDIKENIAATLYKNGVATDVTLTSSVDAYLTAALADTSFDDKTKALLEATQLYGCTADNYFNNAENDFNQMFGDFLTYAGLESDQTPLYAAINNAVANDNVNDEKVSLVLNSKVKLRIYSDNGTNENNYGKYSEITGLTPLTMGQNQTVGGCSVSGYTWVDRVLEKNEIDKNYYMAMALASYMYAAEALNAPAVPAAMAKLSEGFLFTYNPNAMPWDEGVIDDLMSIAGSGYENWSKYFDGSGVLKYNDSLTEDDAKACAEYLGDKSIVVYNAYYNSNGGCMYKYAMNNGGTISTGESMFVFFDSSLDDWNSFSGYYFYLPKE